MRKRLLVLLLTLAMVFTMTACGASKDSSTKDKDEPKQESTDSGKEDAVTKDPVTEVSSGDNTLTVWCWDPAFNINAMKEAAKVYQKDHPDFILNVEETPWADVQTKLTTAAVSGDLSTLPDILLMQDNAFQKNVISYPDAFLSLKDSGIDFANFGAAKVAYSSVDGSNYGVPFDNGAVISCLRTDILKEAGYTVADFTDITWSKYIELGKDVLAKTGKPMISMLAGESDLIMMMLQSAGASLFDAEGNPTIIDNAILNEVMETYSTLVKEGILVEVNDWDQYIGTLTNSTVAGTINGCWIMASIQTAEDQSGNWAVTNMPKFDDVASATNYSNNGGSSWAVTANCKNTDLANDFLASTFAGSVEFYENIISSGALATYLPAGSSTAYGEESAFFGGQKVASVITEFAGKVPSNNTGVYYYEARDAIATALSNIVAGSSIESELKNAQDTVKFQMGQ